MGSVRMDERKMRILHAIIDDYILTAMKWASAPPPSATK